MNNKEREKLVHELFSELGKKGGATRAKRLTKEQLSEIGRKGAKACWEKRRGKG